VVTGARGREARGLLRNPGRAGTRAAKCGPSAPVPNGDGAGGGRRAGVVAARRRRRGGGAGAVRGRFGGGAGAWSGEAGAGMWRGAGTPRLVMDNGGSQVVRKILRLGCSGEFSLLEAALCRLTVLLFVIRDFHGKRMLLYCTN